MDSALKYTISRMFNMNIIGGKHAPEDRLIKKKIKALKPIERKIFIREYKNLINNGLIIRTKKMTGKGSDWHISLNPRKIRELGELLEE